MDKFYIQEKFSLIQVTQSDIDNSDPGTNNNPVVIALKKIVKSHYDIYVRGCIMWTRDISYSDSKWSMNANLPEHVFQFLNSFYENGKSSVKPFYMMDVNIPTFLLRF